jgi:hypothetical protein
MTRGGHLWAIGYRDVEWARLIQSTLAATDTQTEGRT